MRLITLIVSICAVIGTVAAADRPDILVIMVDDAGYNDFGIQGSRQFKTPFIDSIAENGVRFSQAYATSSVCSPARAGMITGRYQQRFGHEANCPPHSQGMEIEEKTMADFLKKAGYRTGIFGKWHLGDKDKYHPNKRGFDSFVGFREGSRSYFPNAKQDKKGNPRAIERNMEHVEWQGYMTDFLADECNKFINEKSDKPYFAFMSFNAPHAPMEAREEHLKIFEDSPRKKLQAMMYALDLAVGRLIKNLKERGTYENTLIFFISDNGGTPVNSSCNWPLKGFKGNCFEGGQRVPFFVQWPSVFEGGRQFGGMVSALDIAATSLAVSGVGLPVERPLDGVDLMPFLKGKEGEPHKALFWRKEDKAAVISGDWKLIRLEHGKDALYNLKNDIRETSNLVLEKPEKAQELQKILATWEKGLVKPYWNEGKYWQKVSLKHHVELINNTSTYSHGPQKKAGYKKAEIR